MALRAWSAEGLATGETHVIRVRTVQRGVAVRFVLKSEATGHLLPDHPFTVYDATGRAVARGRTGDDGEGWEVFVTDRAGVKVLEAGMHTLSIDVTGGDG